MGPQSLEELLIQAQAVLSAHQLSHEALLADETTLLTVCSVRLVERLAELEVLGELEEGALDQQKAFCVMIYAVIFNLAETGNSETDLFQTLTNFLRAFRHGCRPHFDAIASFWERENIPVLVDSDAAGPGPDSEDDDERRAATYPSPRICI